MSSPAVAILVPILLTLMVSTAVAFPFGADSGVTELTPKNFQQFMNTHKPVFIVFYAPWCGHCKSIHPEWEKFAKSVKDVVRVGAVNADEHRDLGSQFGVQGFPTIKFWKMGNKKGMKPSDYQGARTAGAIQSAAVAEIHAKGVVNVVDEPTIMTAIGRSSSGKGILLFTNKKQSPPIFSVLSQSPHFSGKIAFLLATHTSKKLVEAMGVEKFPTLVVVSKGDEGQTVKEMYTGSIDYISIAKHLQGVLGIEAKQEDGAKQEQDTSSQDKKSSTGNEEEAKKKKKPEEKRSAPKAALPVRPVPFNAAMFPQYCAQGSMKLKGQQPLCVVSFNRDVDLQPLHEKFEHEAFLFFDASAAPSSVATQLSEQLSVDPITSTDALLIRAYKSDECKYVVVRSTTRESLDDTLQKAAGGELTMAKSKFVTFTKSTDSDE